MTLNEQRISRIKSRLKERFSPCEIEVIDESHLHSGHAGSKGGLGHFAISIKAPIFAKKSLLEKHRLIYETLGEMMQSDIHALRIIRVT